MRRNGNEEAANDSSTSNKQKPETMSEKTGMEGGWAEVGRSGSG